MDQSVPLDALLRDVQDAHRSGDRGQLAHAVFMARTHGATEADVDQTLSQMNA